MKFFRCLLICMALTGWLQGAVELEVSLSPAQPVAGESVKYTAVLKGAAGSLNILAVPQTSGAQFNWSNPSQSNSTQIINGNMSQSFTLTWSGTAGGEGQHQLSPLVIEVGGKKLQSRSIAFKIGQQQKSNFYIVQSSVDQNDVVLGEMFKYHLDICVADQEFNRYSRYLGNYEMAGRHYDPLKTPAALEQDFHVTLASGREVQGGAGYVGQAIGTREINGYVYHVHRISYLLEPKRSGRIILPAWNMNFYKLELRRDFFGRATPSRTGRPIGAATQAITVKVSPPPNASQHPNFSGQVCRQLSVSLNMEDIQKGQTIQLHSPLSLTVEISSNLPSNANRAPVWKAQDWADFDLNTSAIQRKDEGNKTTFSGIIIRPKSKELKGLPPLTITWYNAQTKKYTESKSNDFPFSVEAVDDQTVLESQAQEVLALQPKTKKKMAEHLYGLELDPELIFATREHSSPLPIFKIISFVALLLSLWWMSTPWRQQWSLQKEKKSQFTSKELLRKMDSAENPGAILEEWSRFICHHGKCSDPHEANFHGDLNAQIKDLLSQLESAQYAPSQHSSSDWKDRVSQLSKEIETHLRAKV